jgi:hypothetical protein
MPSSTTAIIPLFQAASVFIRQLLGKDLAPSSDCDPSIRFSLTPDGKSITYATAVNRSNLWILEGFQQPGLLSQLGLRWPR